MECIPLYLNAQAVGILVCPQCGAQRTVNLRQLCPQVLTIVGEKRATITCRCGAVFQSLWTCGAIRAKQCSSTGR